MSGGLANTRRNPSLSPSPANGVPGSVIAAKWRPAASLPTLDSTTARKWRYKAFVSMVAPDLDDTRKSVVAGSMASVAAWTSDGNTESSTRSSG